MNEKFVITIARGYGSGGRTIGKMLSKNLSIPFYDRDLVYMASEESGINVKLFGQNDESVKKSIFSPASDRYTGDLIPPESSAFVSNKNIFNYQAKIIKDLAVKGSCIIVGRCAAYIFCVLFFRFLFGLVIRLVRQSVRLGKIASILMIANYMSTLIRCVGMNGRGLPNGNGHM